MTIEELKKVLESEIEACDEYSEKSVSATYKCYLHGRRDSAGFLLHILNEEGIHE